MKSLYLSLLILLPLITMAQNVNIPNAAFKNILTSTMCADTDDDGVLDSDVDTNDDGEIQVSEAEAVFYLNTLALPYTNITGINAFVNLKFLYTTGTHLSALSISGLHHLETLNCSWNMLYSIELNGLDQLQTLDCTGNEVLTFLDISGSDNLKTLHFNRTRLINMDVSNLPGLETINCAQSNLSTLTVAANNNITSLSCRQNLNFNMDYSALPNLKTLDCALNNLMSIDVSPLIHLEKLDCSNNSLSTLNISDLTDLKDLNCDHNTLPQLDLSAAASLENLVCSYNNIGSLNTSGSPNLKSLVCDNNQLSVLDINASNQLETVNCSVNILTVLNALNLPNLKELYCASNALTSLSVAGLGQLKTLDCKMNELPALDLSGLAALETLDCSRNSIPVLDVSSSTNLLSLTCNNNQIASLELSGAVALKTLLCSFNGLTALNIDPLVNLELLKCAHNQIMEMDFTDMPNLWSVDLSYNMFSLLDFSQMGGGDHFYFYQLSSNPELTYVNIKNGAHIIHHNGSHDPSKFLVSNCPNLLYICADEFNLGSVHSDTAEINTYCSFSPGGNYNTITGSFTFDDDSDGCDENDGHFSRIRINIETGTDSGATFTNALGNYNFLVGTGNFTITPAFQNPYFTVSPESAVIAFDTVAGIAQTQNFCVTPNGIHNDVDVTIVQNVPARPGFVASYRLVYENKGNQPASGNIILTFDDALLDFISADPTLLNQAVNTLSWSYENLSPFESRIIDFSLQVHSPQETPAVNIDDVLTFTATINPITGDETIRDNTFELAQTVVGSFDPNDKTCLEGAIIATEKIGDYLNYVIRFENSGTAAAENIVVKDMIDTEKFDISSLQLLASSHPNQTKISSNKVEFIFEGINLPPGIDDEAANHGYVAFKIKTKTSLLPGDSVSNTANIHFDYNFPVATNTATTTIALLLAKDTFEDESVSVSPNPVSNELHIAAKQNITSIELYDVQGRLIETDGANGANAVFSMGENESGIYFVKIYTEKGVKVEKIIKQ